MDAQGGAPTIDSYELCRCRKLLYILAWRNFRTRCSQSGWGAGWDVLQSQFAMVVFTRILSRFTKVSADWIPYLVSSFTALDPKTYFASSLDGSASSLIPSSTLVMLVSSVIYFGRIERPFANVV